MAHRIAEQPRCTVTAHVNVELRNRLVNTARASGQSVSAIVALALSAHLKAAA